MRKASGIYVFAGGFTEGVKKHFEVVSHFEDGPYGAATCRVNHPEVRIYDDPPTWRDFMLKPVDFVYANPPCAPWSAAGSKSVSHREFVGGVDVRDPRVACWHNTVDAVLWMSPPVAVIESVTRCWTKGREFVLGVADKMARGGYALTVVLHDGNDCGVPQRRKRAFFVFHRVAFNAETPRGDGPRTVREAFAQVVDPYPELANMWEEEVACLKQTLPGQLLRDVYDRIYGQTKWDPERKVFGGRPGFLRKRLEWDKPSTTITGGATLFHPEEDRHISAREQATLCGYPQSYEFVGSKNLKYQMAAQAVMPPVGAWIAGEVARCLDANEPIRDGLFTREVDYANRANLFRWRD